CTFPTEGMMSIISMVLISLEGFLPSILLLVVIIVAVVIVAVILVVVVIDAIVGVVIVVASIGVVVVFMIIGIVVIVDGGVSHIIKLFFVIIVFLLGLSAFAMAAACASRAAATPSVISSWMVASVITGVADELNIGDSDNTGDRGKIAGRAITTWGGGMNQASTSSTLLSNTIPNTKGEMKAITTQSGVAYEGPSIPTNPSPKKRIDPLLVLKESPKTFSSKWGSFTFPTNFVVVDFEADPRVPLILGRSFLRNGRALIDVYREEITLRVNDEAVTFNLNQTTRYSSTYDDLLVNRIDIVDVAREKYAHEILGFSNNSSGGNPTFTSKPILSDSSPFLTLFDRNDFILEEIEASLKDDSISPEIDHVSCDPEGDICLIEKLLNNDPFQLPPMDLK
nr:reverse transcriptase domain-containing protein [Tanacetum cinerariifolium]